MKNREFKNGLDKVKCSGEFRKKMNDKLSAPINEVHEYANSVHGVDRVENKSFRGIAIGTAACIAVGAGIFSFCNFANKPDMPNDPRISVVETSPAEEVTEVSGEETSTDTFEPAKPSGADEITVGKDEVGTTDDLKTQIYSAIDNAYNTFMDREPRNGGKLFFIEGGGQFDFAYDVEIADEKFKNILDTLGTLNFEQFSPAENDNESLDTYKNTYLSGEISFYKELITISKSDAKQDFCGSISYFKPSDEKSREKYAELYAALEKERYDDVFTIVSHINIGESVKLNYDFIQKWRYSDDTDNAKCPVIFYEGSGELKFDAFSHENYGLVKGQKKLFDYDNEKGDYNFDYVHDFVNFEMEIVNDAYGKSYSREVQHGDFLPVDMDLPYDDISDNGYITRVFEDQWFENPDQKREFACNYDELPYFINTFLRASFDEKSVKDHMNVTIDDETITYMICSEPVFSSKNSAWTLSFSIDQDGILRDYTRTENGKVAAQYHVTKIDSLDGDVELSDTMKFTIEKCKEKNKENQD